MVGGGEGLEGEGEAGEGEVAPARAARGRPVEAEEKEGQPLVAQELDVAELAEAIRREGVEDRGHGRRPGVRREVAHQPEHGEAGEGKRPEQDEVVSDERTGAGAARREDQRDQPQEMLGVGEGPAVRVEHVGVEEPQGGALEGVDVPSQDPRRQDRVAEIGHGGVEAAGEGPGQEHREGDEEGDDGQALAGGPHADRPDRILRARPRDARRSARARSRAAGPGSRPGSLARRSWVSRAPGARAASGGVAPPPAGCRGRGRSRSRRGRRGRPSCRRR